MTHVYDVRPFKSDYAVFRDGNVFTRVTSIEAGKAYIDALDAQTAALDGTPPLPDADDDAEHELEVELLEPKARKTKATSS